MFKRRKIRYRTRKFFGFKEDRWGSREIHGGYHATYGHYSGLPNPGCRTAAEIRDADDWRVQRAEEQVA